MFLMRVALVVTLAFVSGRAAAQPTDPLRRHYERAEAFARGGEFDRAEAEYRTQVLPRALRRLGNLSGAEGAVDESIELLETALVLDPSDADLQTDLAFAWLRARDAARAARFAEGAVQAAPRNARARSVLGRIRLLQGDPAGAAEALRQSLAEEGRFETAYALGLASLHLKRIEAARAMFDQLLGGGRSPDVLVLVGRAYLDAGLRDEAAAHFAEALERSAGHAAAGRYLDLARSGPSSGAGAEPPGTVLLDMLPAASSADAAQRAEMRERLEGVLAATWHNLAVIYTRQGRPNPAADAARRSAHWERRVKTPTEAEPNESAASLEAAGLARAAEGRIEEAEALLGRAVQLDSGLVGAWLALAALHVRGGNVARAEDALARVPPAIDAAAPVRLQVHLAAGRVDDVRALLPPAAAHADSEAAAAILTRLTERGLLDEAERFLDALPPAVGESTQVRVSAAHFELRRGRGERAEALLDGAIAADARSIPALQLRARVAATAGDHEAATELLLRARDAGGDTPDLLRDLTTAAARAGRLEEALAAARRLVALDPDDPEARYLLAIALLQNQEWQEAIATMGSAPPTGWPEPRWPAALGMAHFGAREYGAARRAFEAVLALDAGHVEARYHLGLIAREQGRTADAVTQIERVLELAPDHAAAHAELGGLLLVQNELERARVALERAVALNPDAPAPHYQLGLLYGRLGDHERARRAMQLFQRARDKAMAARPQL